MGRLLQVIHDEKIRKIARYIISGGSAAVVNILTLYVFTEFFHVWYLFSSVIAVCSAWAVSFVLQKFWTFQNFHLHRAHVQALFHAALSLFGVLMNTVLLYIFVEYFHLWYNAGQIIAGVLLACMNYFVFKHYIFPSDEPIVGVSAVGKSI